MLHPCLARCFIAMTDVSFEYWLVSKNSSRGKPIGAQCLLVFPSLHLRRFIFFWYNNRSVMDTAPFLLVSSF